MPVICAFQTSNQFLVRADSIARSSFNNLDVGFFINAYDYGIFRRSNIQSNNIAAFSANSGSVLTHHERLRCRQIRCFRSNRHMASLEYPVTCAKRAPFHWLNPEGGSFSKVSKIVFLNSSVYLAGLPGIFFVQSPERPDS